MDRLYLKDIKLTNFRNYEEQVLAFDEGFNFLMGNNAQGKTNLVEAIYMLSAGRSFRTFMDSELVRWGSGTLYIKGTIVGDEGEKAIEIAMRGNNKKIKVNGILLEKRGDLFGKFISVIFSPEELKLVKEGPSYRRKFMDQGVTQVKPSYYYLLINYKKVLFQRNSLLREWLSGKADADVLTVWDRQLAGYGARMVYERYRFVRTLSALSKLVHSRITNGEEDLEIKYQSCVDIKEDMDPEEIRQQFVQKLESARARDIKTGVTSFGPHREDLVVLINGMDARKFGSQGQQRTAALSMKLSEIELLKSETGECPVLLLDDVMSELDPSRQQYILGNLTDVQTFITCTHITGIMKKSCPKGKVFHVDSGIITTEEQ